MSAPLHILQPVFNEESTPASGTSYRQFDTALR